MINLKEEKLNNIYTKTHHSKIYENYKEKGLEDF